MVRSGVTKPLSMARPASTSSDDTMTSTLPGLGVSAKTGAGVHELLDALIDRIPPPKGDPESSLQAMVFDAHYDEYRGAVTYVRVMNGTIRKGQKVRMVRGGTTHEVLELGQFAPQRLLGNQRAGGPNGNPRRTAMNRSDVGCRHQTAVSIV